jgi:hypothetical protein
MRHLEVLNIQGLQGRSIERPYISSLETANAGLSYTELTFLHDLHK